MTEFLVYVPQPEPPPPTRAEPRPVSAALVEADTMGDAAERVVQVMPMRADRVIVLDLAQGESFDVQVEPHVTPTR
jgi:hypothetical protein